MSNANTVEKEGKILVPTEETEYNGGMRLSTTILVNGNMYWIDTTYLPGLDVYETMVFDTDENGNNDWLERELNRCEKDKLSARKMHGEMVQKWLAKTDAGVRKVNEFREKLESAYEESDAKGKEFIEKMEVLLDQYYGDKTMET